MGKTLLRRSQPIFLLIALLLIVWTLRSQWTELRTYAWRLHSGWLVLSAIWLMAAWAVEIEIWRRLLRWMGGILPFGAAIRIWFLSAVVRYIPGNIWHPISMTLYCQQHHIRPEATVSSIIFYQVIILLAALPYTIVYFFMSQEAGFLAAGLQAVSPRMVMLLLLPVLLFLLRPAWLIGLLNWLLHKISRPALDAALTSGQMLLVLLLALIDWALWGACFAALTFGISEFTQTEMVRFLPHLLVSYAIAYAAGFISFVTPSGFGVREGAFYLLLSPMLGGAVATVAALAMRIWTTLGELLAALLSTLVQSRLAISSLVVRPGPPSKVE